VLNTGVAPWPSFTAEEQKAVAEVLASNRVNYWTGEEARAFEREFAKWSGCARAVALMNGTVALDLALTALGIGPGDEVVVTPRTFIASVSCVVNVGARPVFTDVDPDSGNITPAQVAAVLTERTRAVIPVHLGGWPCDMVGFEELLRGRGIAVIEDCAQAHGAQIGNRSVGTFGDVGAWSFCQDKIMTTGGEGGMVTTRDEALWARMWSYKDHGKNWNAVYEKSHPPGFRWLHDSFGTNWRMLEMQAAIGRIQLRRMGEWSERRRVIAIALSEALRPFGASIRVPQVGTGTTHAFYRLYSYIRPDGLKTGWDRDRIVAALVDRGCPAFQGSCSEVYLEKAFDRDDLRPLQRLPVARELGETSIAFLVHPTLSDAQVARIASAIQETMAESAR
jgi:dTDP-4-amino-4,6-dideoxygalactose transaminase